MKTLVFIHGWSVTNLNTYGGLPQRMAGEALRRGVPLKMASIYLGRYISFHDEVTLADIARALQAALEDRPDLTDFICITHSTGGPVVRLWWETYYSNKPCPISHLIMLAPANFGSALAQLGKSKLSRIMSFFEGVEPGQGVLDWLELGSAQAWTLNENWIKNGSALVANSGTYPFVLIGQSIDRAFYDHLNTYTGELGSDGVVRTAAANINANYIKLEQEVVTKADRTVVVTSNLVATEDAKAPATAMRVISGKSHSGSKMGIMGSVTAKVIADQSTETVNAIFDCMKVSTDAEYQQLATAFEGQTASVQKAERVETETELFLFHKTFIHDIYTQVIFRVQDHEGNSITDFDLILTAGDDNDRNHLPEGFAVDRQKNSISHDTVTYYFNYTVMQGISKLGLIIQPRPDKGFVRYYPCSIAANAALFNKAIQPNATTLIDIQLHRAVSREVFALEPTNPKTQVMDFSKVDWKGKGIV
jgi:hypothetical protein